MLALFVQPAEELSTPAPGLAREAAEPVEEVGAPAPAAVVEPAAPCPISPALWDLADARLSVMVQLDALAKQREVLAQQEDLSEEARLELARQTRELQAPPSGGGADNGPGAMGEAAGGGDDPPG